MPYNFDELTERRGTGSMKWDVPEGELPMWVADMDFETASSIKTAATYSPTVTQYHRRGEA